MWNEIIELYKDFQAAGINQAVDYNKFYLYSLITHSTAIEGSTLSEQDSYILFDEGLTAKGKPLLYHLMNKDLKDAYDYAIIKAEEKTQITPDFLKTLNALLMHSTGTVHNVIAGSFDSSKGEYRLCSVSAGFKGRSYMNFQKIANKTEELCRIVNTEMQSAKTIEQQYKISFLSHLNLVTIHPWVDGNGRTARLLSNYIQLYYGLFPSKIFVEDREEYINSLKNSQETENAEFFMAFMASQLKKSLTQELTAYNKNKNKGFHLMF